MLSLRETEDNMQMQPQQNVECAASEINGPSKNKPVFLFIWYRNAVLLHSQTLTISNSNQTTLS